MMLMAGMSLKALTTIVHMVLASDGFSSNGLRFVCTDV